MDESIKQILFRVLPFLLIIIGLSVAVKRKKLSTKDLFRQPPSSARKFLLWWVSFVLFVLLTELTLSHLGVLEVSSWKDKGAVYTIIKILGIVVLAPIAEELVFRGLLLHKLTKWGLYINLAIIVQALIFVVLHGVVFDYSVSSGIAMAQIFIDAILFASAMYSTRSVYTPIAMHATGNLIAVAEQFLLN